jgi:hypothetical protein
MVYELTLSRLHPAMHSRLTTRFPQFHVNYHLAPLTTTLLSPSAGSVTVTITTTISVPVVTITAIDWWPVMIDTNYKVEPPHLNHPPI